MTFARNNGTVLRLKIAQIININDQNVVTVPRVHTRFAFPLFLPILNNYI